MITKELVEQWSDESGEKAKPGEMVWYIAQRAYEHGAEQAKTAMQTDVKLDAVAYRVTDTLGNSFLTTDPRSTGTKVEPLCTLESAQQAVAAERAKFHDMDMHHVYKRTDYLLRITALEAALRQAVDALEKCTKTTRIIDAITAGKEALK